jgi:hypothetical protein
VTPAVAGLVPARAGAAVDSVGVAMWTGLTTMPCPAGEPDPYGDDL